MRIGILSDTHGFFDEHLASYLRECDEVWHAGDIGDMSVLKALRGLGPEIRAVHGNIDDATIRLLCPETANFISGGAHIIMQHIGGYPGRYAPGVRRLLAEERPVIFVSGHSHLLRVMFDRDLGILHINPGAAGMHGWQQVRTLVRLDINEGTPSNLEVIELGPRRL